MINRQLLFHGIIIWCFASAITKNRIQFGFWFSSVNWNEKAVKCVTMKPITYTYWLCSLLISNRQLIKSFNNSKLSVFTSESCLSVQIRSLQYRLETGKPEPLSDWHHSEDIVNHYLFILSKWIIKHSLEVNHQLSYS